MAAWARGNFDAVVTMGMASTVSFCFYDTVFAGGSCDDVPDRHQVWFAIQARSNKGDLKCVVAPSHLVEPTSSILIIYQARHCDIFVRSFSFFQDFGLTMTWLLPLARWWWVEEACTLSIYCADHARFIQTVAQSSDNDSGMKTLI